MLWSPLAFAVWVSRMTLGRFLLALAICNGDQSFGSEAHAGVVAAVRATIVAATGKIAFGAEQTLCCLGEIDLSISLHVAQSIKVRADRVGDAILGANQRSIQMTITSSKWYNSLIAIGDIVGLS